MLARGVRLSCKQLTPETYTSTQVVYDDTFLAAFSREELATIIRWKGRWAAQHAVSGTDTVLPVLRLIVWRNLFKRV